MNSVSDMTKTTPPYGLLMVYYCILQVHGETTDTVLRAEDKLDDGSPIVLEVTINKEQVKSFMIKVL